MLVPQRVALLFFSFIALSKTLPSSPNSYDPNEKSVVTTTSGRLKPLVDQIYPDVEQFLGVPFAQPPVNNLRFAPPKAPERATGVFDASIQPPGCMQPQSITNIFSVYEPGLTFHGPQSEDCLKLDIYRPKDQPSKSLPIIVFVYGGGFSTGAANKSYEIPTPWVQAKQNLIIVKIQYRLGIFGFPNSAALSQSNLGLEDIRFAVEWVHENAAAFGGDPDRITLWGHSAGSIAVNAYTFSQHIDPIVHSTISTSGTVLTPQEGWQSRDTSHSNFTFVAQHLGCSGDAQAQLTCMRSKSASTIMNTVNKYNSTLVFKPIVDGVNVFANYTTLVREGKVAKQPAIIGNSRREGERSLDVNLNPNGPNQTDALAYTVVSFVCPGELMSKLRYEAGLQTYRYEWKGNFSNISPLPWMGAYHASLLSFFFGQTNNHAAHPLSGSSTSFELKVGGYMQDLWRAYASDPVSLATSFDWPLYLGGAPNETTDAVKVIPGAGDKGVVSNIEYGAKREEYCAMIDPYLISQTLPPGYSAGASSGLSQG